jgi:hypothetical protein
MIVLSRFFMNWKQNWTGNGVTNLRSCCKDQTVICGDRGLMMLLQTTFGTVPKDAMLAHFKTEISKDLLMELS